MGDPGDPGGRGDFWSPTPSGVVQRHRQAHARRTHKPHTHTRALRIQPASQASGLGFCDLTHTYHTYTHAYTRTHIHAHYASSQHHRPQALAFATSHTYIPHTLSLSLSRVHTHTHSHTHTHTHALTHARTLTHGGDRGGLGGGLGGPGMCDMMEWVMGWIWGGHGLDMGRSWTCWDWVGHGWIRCRVGLDTRDVSMVGQRVLLRRYPEAIWRHNSLCLHSVFFLRVTIKH